MDEVLIFMLSCLIGYSICYYFREQEKQKLLDKFDEQEALIEELEKIVRWMRFPFTDEVVEEHRVIDGDIF